ncbi:MAG: CorA family divalent cation transporter, partial [Synergistaceae bacterium]|nr:CorA family divalent cation transporter [Synergistaceae bacterium]
KEILARSHYYSQLSDVALELIENENEIFDDPSLRLLKHFSDRAHRLRQETQMLREYSLQISDAYQTQIDIRQNVVMKVLTVVTAIFLPLTLIAGWYGMNFDYMPELRWDYGYLYVFILSIMVVIGCLWIFKRKKFLK